MLCLYVHNGGQYRMHLIGPVAIGTRSSITEHKHTRDCETGEKQTGNATFSSISLISYTYGFRKCHGSQTRNKRYANGSTVNTGCIAQHKTSVVYAKRRNKRAFPIANQTLRHNSINITTVTRRLYA